MARVVWKYLVPFASRRGKMPTAPMSWNARPAHCGLDPETGNVAVWVVTDDAGEVFGDRELFAFPTGAAVPDDWEHWGSVIANQEYVWHVFAGPRIARDRSVPHPCQS